MPATALISHSPNPFVLYRLFTQSRDPCGLKLPQLVGGLWGPDGRLTFLIRSGSPSPEDLLDRRASLRRILGFELTGVIGRREEEVEGAELDSQETRREDTVWRLLLQSPAVRPRSCERLRRLKKTVTASHFSLTRCFLFLREGLG